MAHQQRKERVPSFLTEPVRYYRGGVVAGDLVRNERRPARLRRPGRKGGGRTPGCGVQDVYERRRGLLHGLASSRGVYGGVPERFRGPGDVRRCSEGAWCGQGLRALASGCGKAGARSWERASGRVNWNSLPLSQGSVVDPVHDLVVEVEELVRLPLHFVDDAPCVLDRLEQVLVLVFCPLKLLA